MVICVWSLLPRDILPCYIYSFGHFQEVPIKRTVKISCRLGQVWWWSCRTLVLLDHWSSPSLHYIPWCYDGGWVKDETKGTGMTIVLIIKKKSNLFYRYYVGVKSGSIIGNDVNHDVNILFMLFGYKVKVEKM